MAHCFDGTNSTRIKLRVDILGPELSEENEVSVSSKQVNMTDSKKMQCFKTSAAGPAAVALV